MRMTLRAQLAKEQTEHREHLEKLRNAEVSLRALIRRRRFNRGQKKALLALAAEMHVKSFGEVINDLAKAYYLEGPRTFTRIKNLVVPAK